MCLTKLILLQDTTFGKEKAEQRSIQCATREIALKAISVINQAYAEYKACE